MKDFKLSINSLGMLVNELTKLLTSTNKVYRLSVKEWKESRSLSQNALMWKWLAEINKQSPLVIENSPINGAELWHEVFKKYYCPVKNITNKEKVLPIKSTKVLDVGEMTFYLARIENFCLDRGLTITIPEDSEYNKLILKQSE